MPAPRVLITGGSGCFGFLLRDGLCMRGQSVRILTGLMPTTVCRASNSRLAIFTMSRPSARLAPAAPASAIMPPNAAGQRSAAFLLRRTAGTPNLLRVTGVSKAIYVPSSVVFGAKETNSVYRRVLRSRQSSVTAGSVFSKSFSSRIWPVATPPSSAMARSAVRQGALGPRQTPAIRDAAH